MLPQTPINGHIGEPLVILPQVESSNNYAMAQVHAGLATHGIAYLALDQTQGKGQRGRTWNSVAGESLTISFVVEPFGLPISQQFILSASVALACYDFLNKYAVSDCSIKWPNDLFWNDRKAGGILIENIISGDNWTTAVIGIGMNINQGSFETTTGRPVSLKQICGRHLEIVEVAKELAFMLDARLHQKKLIAYNDILTEFNSCLYKQGQVVKLQKENIVFETKIKSVTERGTLITEDSLEREFNIGEIQWLN